MSSWPVPVSAFDENRGVVGLRFELIQYPPETGLDPYNGREAISAYRRIRLRL